MTPAIDACLAAHRERRVPAAGRLLDAIRRELPEGQALPAALAVVERDVQELRDAGALLHVPPCSGASVRTGDIASVFRAAVPDSASKTPPPVSLVLDSIVSADLCYLLVLLRETGLYTQWLPGIVRDACRVSLGDDGEPAGSWVCFETPVPPLLSSRDACLATKYFDCLDETPPAVLFVTQDAPCATVPRHWRGGRAAVVRMSVPQAVVRLQLTPTRAVRVTAYAAVDPRAQYCPAVVSSKLVAAIGTEMVEQLGIRARQVASEHRRHDRHGAPRVSADAHVRAIENDHVFYTELFARVRQCCEST